MRSGRNDLGGEQTRRLEHKEMSAATKNASARSRISRVVAGSRPTPLLGKADDAEEETGKSTSRYRRARGPGIRGKICRDNVGKIPLAAGTGSNLQRLLRSEERRVGKECRSR